jgi:hypothetical protein
MTALCPQLHHCGFEQMSYYNEMTKIKMNWCEKELMAWDLTSKLYLQVK